jgi:hypothetical protein
MVASINERSLKVPVAVKFRYKPLHPMSSAVVLLGIVNGISHNVFTDRHRCLHFGLDCARHRVAPSCCKHQRCSGPTAEKGSSQSGGGLPSWFHLCQW